MPSLCHRYRRQLGHLSVFYPPPRDSGIVFQFHLMTFPTVSPIGRLGLPYLSLPTQLTLHLPVFDRLFFSYNTLGPDRRKRAKPFRDRISTGQHAKRPPEPPGHAALCYVIVSTIDRGAHIVRVCKQVSSTYLLVQTHYLPCLQKIMLY